MAEDPNVIIIKEIRKRRFFLELIKNTSSCCLNWVRIDRNQYKASKDNFEFYLTSNNREIILDVHKNCRYAASYRSSENEEITDLYDLIVLIQDKQFDIVAQEEKNLIELLRWCRCTDTYDEYPDGGVVLGGEALVYQPQRIFEEMDGGVVVGGIANERQAERFFETMDGGVVVGGGSALSINADTYIYIWFDNSGSMNSSLAPLVEMRDTLLKDALLPFYNNDSTRYDERVTVQQYPVERTFDVVHRTAYADAGLGQTGNIPRVIPYSPPDSDYEFPEDANNVVMMWFQDESSPYENSVSDPDYITDITILRDRVINEFPENFYRCIFFVVNGYAPFKAFMEDVELGSASGNPGGDPPTGLSDRDEFLFKYNIIDGGTPEYYLEEVLTGLEDLGFVVR